MINKSTLKIHFFFLFILSLNYIIPTLLFGKITLFYHDALDSEIVYNHVIGKYLNGNKEAISLFLNDQIKLEYLRRLYQPFTYLYMLLDTEVAYWITDVSVKLTSYFSFFILAKKINKNLIECSLVSCLYASINLPTLTGFGLAILPYLFYISFFKDRLLIKHYLIIIFFGLNSDLVVTILSIPLVGLLILLFNKFKLLNFFKISIIFISSIILSNFNLIFAGIDSSQLHRVEFVRDDYEFFETVNYFFTSLLKIPPIDSSSFLVIFPLTLIVVPLFIGIFFINEKEYKYPIYISILVYSILSLLKFNPIASVINQEDNLIKTFTWDYLSSSLIFFYMMSFIFLLKLKRPLSKLIFYTSILSILILQINSSIVPFIKEKILKIDRYQNIYTFNGYYDFYDYPFIKKIVGNKRTLSIGVDPMIAVYHNINVIDGYHNTYPVNYKKTFRKIIEPELNSNPNFRKYYDNYGSRVYTSLYHPQNIKNIVLNFKEAKLIGAEYVISKYAVDNEDLVVLSKKCLKHGLCLYQIK